MEQSWEMYLPHPDFIPSFLSAPLSNTGPSRDTFCSLFSHYPVIPLVHFDLISFSKEKL